MSADAELDEIRRRRLQDLRKSLAAEQQQANAQEAVESQKQALLRQILTADARQRLARIKLVKPQFAAQMELQLIQVAQQGRLRLPITDAQLKTLLRKLQPAKREITFRRI